MIQVVIGEDKRDLRDVDSAWLRASIEHQRNAGVPVCVQVVMNFAQVNMILATSGCPAGGAPKPELNAEEMKILEVWQRRGLNREGFAIHDLEQFLKQLKRWI